MLINFSDIILGQDDLDSLSDILLNSLDKEGLTNDQLIEYWDMLPDDIKIEVFQYGVSDTPTREKIFKWVQENCKK